MQSSQFDLLKTRRFLPLFITQFFGAFNDNVFKNALIILITYQVADHLRFNPQILVNMASGILILPFFLFSATAGEIADKFEKSRLIAITKLVEIFLMVLATIGFYTQSVSLLMSVLFLLGVQAAFFGPLKYAILPAQLRENELIAGNGLIEAGTFISILLGTIIGGALILLPIGASLISAMICLVAVAGFISSLYIPKTTHTGGASVKVHLNFIHETVRLLNYSRQRWDIFLAILGISWFWLVGYVFLAELPLFVKDNLHANAHVVTFFISLFAIGIAIGSLLCNRLLKGKVHATYVPLGALGMTIFILDLYFAAKSLHIAPIGELRGFWQLLFSAGGWRIAFDLLLIAICGGIYTVPLYAILQQRSPEEHRARVIASNNVMNALFMVAAAIGTLIMLKVGFSINTVLLVVAILNGIVTVYVCKLLPDVLMKAILRYLLKLFYHVKVVGLENYKQAGDRVVIVANHTSYLDAILLAVFLPDKLTYAVDTTTAQKWWIKFFLSMVDAYPLNPANPMALKSLIELVKQDKRCVIFPEGRLTMTGALMKIYEGPGLIADKANAKLLPVRIQGAQFTPFSRLRGKVPLRWMPKITLTIFPAQSLAVSADEKGRQRRQHVGHKLYDLMTNVMFESSDYQTPLFPALIDAKTTHGRRYKVLEDIEREPLSYQQLITRSLILGDVIANNTQPGEQVGVLLPNVNTVAIIFFALQAICRVPAMLNYSAGIKNVVIACQTAQVKTVYSSQKFVRFAKLTDMVNALKEAGVDVIYLENVRARIGIFRKLKGILLAQFPNLAYRWLNRLPAAKALRDSAETPAIVLFTSGSEGTPKGVVLSHKNIQANRYQMTACIDFTASDKILNALPVFHSFGMTAGMLLPILSGVKVFFYPSPLHYRIVPELSYDTNATILFGTDTFLSGYAKYAHAYDFYSIRYVFSGAEKLREETINIWARKFGVRIFEGYGATETSPVLATNTPMQNQIGSVGRFLPGIQYMLRPVPGVEDGGVLMVSGPNIMKGYLMADNPGVIVPPEDGWYDTGDIVSVDSEGYIRIKGRVKRFAKIGGEMVSLTMVEQQVNKLWPDYQHAVINLPDPRKGEVIVLVTTHAKAAREELVAYAKANHMAEISIPKKIIVLKAIPLLGSGKVDYTAVREHVCHPSESQDVDSN